MTLNHRQEIRFAITSSQLDNMTQHLLNEGYEKITYSDKPITQTIYFNHDKFFIPFNLSLKMRRYISAPDSDIVIDNSQDYVLEKKSFVFENDIHIPMKHKERTVMSGKKILEYFYHTPLSTVLNEFNTTSNYVNINNLFSGIYLYPHIATQYRRQHFTKGEHIRITIDNNLQTFYFDEQMNSVETTQHKCVPIEIKCDDISMEGELEKILKHLRNDGAEMALSKKNLALNAIFYNKKSKIGKDYILTKEFPDDEMESKYSIDVIPPELVFLVLRKIFEEGANEYTIGAGYPFSEEIGSIHKYYEHDNKVFRFAYSGDIGTTSSKSSGDHNQEILSRQEKKEKSVRFQSLGNMIPSDSKILGEITRIRRNFWIENHISGRVYKVAVDNAYNQLHRLSQIELEYTGIRPGRVVTDNKSIIFSEMETINNLIQANQHIKDYISPTNLTKLDWIMSLK